MSLQYAEIHGPGVLLKYRKHPFQPYCGAWRAEAGAVSRIRNSSATTFLVLHHTSPSFPQKFR